MSPIAAIECGSAENFGDEMGDGAKVLGGHIRKYRREERVSRNALIESHEKGFEPFDAANPVVQRGYLLRFHGPSSSTFSHLSGNQRWGLRVKADGLSYRELLRSSRSCLRSGMQRSEGAEENS